MWTFCSTTCARFNEQTCLNGLVNQCPCHCLTCSEHVKPSTTQMVMGESPLLRCSLGWNALYNTTICRLKFWTFQGGISIELAHKAAAFARGEPSVSVPGCTVTNCGKLLTTTLRDTQRELCVLLCKGCTRTRVWDFSPSAGGVLYCKYIFLPLVLLRATTLTKDSTTTIAFLFSPSQVVDVIFVDESIYLN